MDNSLSQLQSSGDNLPAPIDHSQLPIHHRAQWGGDGERPPLEGATSSSKIRRYIQAIMRYKWLIMLLAVLGTAAGLLATRFVQPVYEAHGAVWISDVSSQGGGGNNPMRAPELLPTGSWVELFRSFAVVDRVVEAKRLFLSYEEPSDSTALSGLNSTSNMPSGFYTFSIDPSGQEYTLSEKELGLVEQGKLGDSVGRRVGFLWAPTAQNMEGKRSVSFHITQPRTVAVALAKNIQIVMEQNSNFLKLTLTGVDKWKTADLLNKWMEEFVATASDLRRKNMSDVAQILESQREEARASLRQAEQSLQSFRTQNITEPGEESPVGAVGSPGGAGGGGGAAGASLATAFFENQGNYESVQRDRKALEDVAVSAENGELAPDAVLSISAVAQAPALTGAIQELIQKEGQLRTLRESYTDEYKAVKDMKHSIDQLRSYTIPRLARESAALLRSREQTLSSRLRRDSIQLRNVPQRSIEEARLRRDLAVAENLYTTLEGRYETTRLGAVTTLPDVNILDPALPSAAPSLNLKLLLLVAGFAGSLGLGVLLALFMDHTDKRFRYPEQIADDLHLEVIGAIPVVPKAKEALHDPEAMLHSVEAFRGLRMRTHHFYDSPPVMLTISSPGAGDGKSMITSNLALSFAEAGFKTLIIDGDIRRGKLHSVFSVDRRPGLLDFLSGQASIQDIIRPVENNAKLFVLTSGTRRHRGPELLTSAALPELLNALRDQFDVILVDSAPLGAGIDAYAFGVATGNMAVVMRTGVSDRRMAKAKVKLLERFPVRILGAIVNDVPSAGLYQEYSYLYGYSPDSDMGDQDPGEMGLLTSEISDASTK